MSRYHDRHHFHLGCRHWCGASRCDPTAHAAKCPTCAELAAALIDPSLVQPSLQKIRETRGLP